MSRIGAARIFFDVVGIFQAEKFLTDSKSSFLAWKAITSAIVIDTLTAVNEAIELFGEQFSNVIESTVPLAVRFAEARIEFVKFSQAIEGANLEQMGQEVRDIGEGFAFTADQSYAAAGRMSQLSGVLRSQEAILAATTGAIQFGFVGGMETETAAKRLIQLQAQTSFMFGNVTQAQYDLLSAQEQAALVTSNLGDTMSALNTIENRSAATMSQLTFVMNQFASSAVLAGDSIEEMAAMSAVLIESGEEQGKAGRALRIMYARLGANMSHNNEILEHYIGSIRDSNGQMLGMAAIMKKLHPHWQVMSQDQKMQLSQAIAGNDHYVRFIKLMDGYERSVVLTTQAMQGLDDVYEEMALFTEDPAFQLKILNAEIENTKEMIGQELLPVSIAMAEAEKNMLEGIEMLANAFSGFLSNDTLFSLIEMGKTMYEMAQASFDMYLNLRNMAVATQTQMLIMRAIQGDKFIEVQNNKNILMTSEANLVLIKHRNRMEYEYHMAKDATLKLTTIAKEKTEEHVALEKELLDLTKTRKEWLEAGSMYQALEMEGWLNIGEVIKGLSAEEAAILDIHKQATADAAERVSYAKAEGEIRAADAGNYLGFYMTEAQHSEEMIGLNSENTRLKQLANELDSEAFDRMHETLFLQQESGAITQVQADHQAVLLVQLEEQMEAHRNLNVLSKEELAALEAKLRLMTSVITETLMTEGAEHGLTLTRAELAFITELLTETEYAEALAAAAAAEASGDAAEAARQEAIAKAHLTDAINDTRAARAGELDPAKQALYQSQVTADKHKEWKKQYEGFNRTMTAVSLGAGAAALAFQGLGRFIGLDKKESAAAGMVAMTLAMIPAQVQMFYMTAEMMALGESTMTTAAAMGTLKKVVATTFIVIGAVSYLAAKYASSRKQAEEFTEAQLDLNQSLLDFYNIVSPEDFAMLVDEDDRSVQQLTESIAAQNQVIADKTALMEAADPITAGLYQTEIDGLNDVLAADMGLLKHRQANLFGGRTQEEIEAFTEQLAILESGMYDYHHTKELASGNTNPFRVYGSAASGLSEGKLLAEFATQAELDAWMVLSDGMKAWGKENALFITWWNEVGNTGYTSYWNNIEKGQSMYVDQAPAVIDATEGLAETWDDATASLEDFSGAAEEFFYGGDITMATGDLLKQIVSKGAENLIQNTELLMTNNFYGLTLPQMVEAVADGVTEELYNRGVVT